MAKIDPGHESDDLILALRVEAKYFRAGTVGPTLQTAGLLALAADEIQDLRRELGRLNDRAIHAAAGIVLPPVEMGAPAPAAPRPRRGRPPKDGAAPPEKCQHEWSTHEASGGSLQRPVCRKCGEVHAIAGASSAPAVPAEAP